MIDIGEGEDPGWVGGWGAEGPNALCLHEFK